MDATFQGFTRCPPHSADCNVCTNDVAGQFSRFVANQASWQTKPWRFDWGKGYPPRSLRPFDTFDEDGGWSDAIGVSYSHTQGFVRTNSAQFPYAGSHSARKGENKPGSVFIIREDSVGKKWLSSLFPAYGQHPSGVHTLGRYVFFGDVGAEREGAPSKHFVRWLNVNLGTLTGQLELPNQGFGGGLGIVRLANGDYLLLATTPGDRKAGPRYFDFYLLKGSLREGGTLRYEHLHQASYVTPAAWRGKDYGPSENVSLLTECGTGDIYAVHTSGDGSEKPEAAGGLLGGGYWRLSKLTGGASSLQLTPLDILVMPQSTADCHLRSAATVGVFRDKLEFLCHQYRKDPDPSVLGTILNPLSAIRGNGEDAFKFRAGVLR